MLIKVTGFNSHEVLINTDNLSMISAISDVGDEPYILRFLFIGTDDHLEMRFTTVERREKFLDMLLVQHNQTAH